jgi:hypothetical protein
MRRHGLFRIDVLACLSGQDGHPLPIESSARCSDTA